jgi:type II secretory pathway pseudopilin PulG
MRIYTKNTYCCRGAFTLVEALTALVIVGFVCGTVLIVINNCIDSVSDMESRLRAVDVARENLESLLAQNNLKEFSETGISELYPDIEWVRGVEVTEFQGTSDMWMKAFSSANFYNTDNELEEVEFENWLAPLTDQQEAQVLKDRQKEDEYLDELELERLEELENAMKLEEEQQEDQLNADGEMSDEDSDGFTGFGNDEDGEEDEEQRR